MSIGANSQIVNIPDTNFKAYLVSKALVNTNGDTEIQVSEANAFSGALNCSSRYISDLTGIEYFTDLIKLFCYENQLTSLDLTQNTALTLLNCNFNQLTSLDLTQNTDLENLKCSDNYLTYLTRIIHGYSIPKPNYLL